MFIDTHCHFDAPPFIENIAESVQYFEQAGVNKIIIPTVSKDKFNDAVLLATEYSAIYFALGLHPIYSHHKYDLDILSFELDKQHRKLVAIGEIGLDGYIDHADLEQQTFFLLQQLFLAKKYHLPVILHSRKTHSLLLSLLKKVKHPETGVIHGFAGSYEEAMQFIRLGYAIGVGGIISYPRANKTRGAISRIPLSSIVLETDSPDMPLMGSQGKPNRPENIVNVFKELVLLRSENPLQILDTILSNTLTLFPRINTIKNI